jgi:DNA polymerase I-like protein with 3'-5' exonuclease and polymerase domains
MNVTNRKQFDAFLKDMANTTVRVFDTETNGLEPYKDTLLVSMSVYFPENGRVYNLPFRQGVGQVEIHYTPANPATLAFEDMKWSARAKKDLYLSYWYTHYYQSQMQQAWANNGNPFENLPMEWLEEVKAVWGPGVYIGHNTRFDAHVLFNAGFPDMETVYDTMIALHIVHEDWRHVEMEAPYTYNKKDAPSADVVGMWAKDADGKLLKRRQWGNRQLKWITAALDIPNATDGETMLFTARRAFEQTLIDHILGHLDDPMNAGLLTASIKRGKRGEAELAKQREKIAAKIKLDDKAHLWMLPSSQVATYAELDVILTHRLYEWCLSVIKEWDNLPLWETQSAYHHNVAWEMERNGIKVDEEEAARQIEQLQGYSRELIATLQEVAFEWLKLEDASQFNPFSNPMLLSLLNSGVLGHDYSGSLFPAWWEDTERGNLKVYPNVRLVEADVEDPDEFVWNGEYNMMADFEGLDSTDKRHLDGVADHPVVRLVQKLRLIDRAVKNYLTKWVKMQGNDGRVRFNMNDDGTVSGRLSSSGGAGNGQNIPDRGWWKIKRALVAPDDRYIIVAADYGQLELRLASYIAETLLNGDPEKSMTRLFLSGEDMHSYVRDNIDVRGILYGQMTDREILVKLLYPANHKAFASHSAAADAVAKHCRQVAKTLNFGIIYSGGVPMVQNLLKIDDENAARLLVKRWRAMFPAFAKAQQFFTELSTTRRLRPDGRNYGMYATQPISGRHRKLHRYATNAGYTVNGERLYFNPREAAARKVWNNTVQGLGGYLAMTSALRTFELVPRGSVNLFANIHDALEGWADRENLQHVGTMLQCMTDWPEIVPSLTVELSASVDGTWQGLAPVKDFDLWVASQGKEGYAT